MARRVADRRARACVVATVRRGLVGAQGVATDVDALRVLPRAGLGHDDRVRLDRHLPFGARLRRLDVARRPGREHRRDVNRVRSAAEEMVGVIE